MFSINSLYLVLLMFNNNYDVNNSLLHKFYTYTYILGAVYFISCGDSFVNNIQFYFLYISILATLIVSITLRAYSLKSFHSYFTKLFFALSLLHIFSLFLSKYIYIQSIKDINTSFDLRFSAEYYIFILTALNMYIFKIESKWLNNLVLFITSLYVISTLLIQIIRISGSYNMQEITDLSNYFTLFDIPLIGLIGIIFVYSFKTMQIMYVLVTSYALTRHIYDKKRSLQYG